jgi:hypothetical protein
MKPRYAARPKAHTLPHAAGQMPAKIKPGVLLSSLNKPASEAVKWTVADRCRGQKLRFILQRPSRRSQQQHADVKCLSAMA